jgi:RNA polymerase sigma-70 factor, ECF subfamily
MQNQQNLTSMLLAWNAGDADALDRLMAVVYPMLRQIARHHLRRRGTGDTLESAALANETYLKLVRAGGIRCENRAHFLALCSQMMRRILVDHARRRSLVRRGGNTVRLTLDETLLTAQTRGVDILALDAALDRLAQVDVRKCRVVELRYFGGLSIEETAAFLGISVDTVKRDWRMARAWLLAALAGQPAPATPR